MKRIVTALFAALLLFSLSGFLFAGQGEQQAGAVAGTQTLIEQFTNGTPDLTWDFNTVTYAAGDTMYVADSTASTWGSYVGVFEDQAYTGLLYVKDAYFADFTVSADIFLYGEPNANAPLYTGIAIKMRSDEMKYYRLVYRNSSSSDHGILKLQGYDGASWHISKVWQPGADFDSVTTGWHNFKVIVRGNHFWAYFDGKELPGCPVSDDQAFIVEGYPGIYKYNGGNGRVIFDNFKIEPMQITRIADIQTPTDPNTSDASPLIDSVVTVQGIVSGVSKYGYFLQDDSAAWSGIYVYTTNKPNVGDEVIVTATVSEYKNLTELKNVTQTLIISSNNTPYNPILITAGDFGEPYESVAVRVNDVTCTNPDLGYGEWEVQDATGTMRIDDMFIKFTPIQGQHYNITGIGYYSYGNYKLEPRDSSEVEVFQKQATLPLFEGFTNGSMDLDWDFNTVTFAAGDTLYVADSTGSDWNSYIGVFEDQAYTGLLHVKDAVFQDYTISADIFLYGDPNPDAPLYTGIAIKTSHDAMAYYRFVYRNSSSSDNGILKLQGYDGSSWHISKVWRPGEDFEAIQTGWHNLKVTVKGNQFWVYLDGEQLPGCPLQDDNLILSEGYPGIFKYNGGFARVLFDNFRVTTPQPTLPAYNIVINEIHYNPAGSDTTEFIELYNAEPFSIDLSGYYFSAGVTFTFPEGTVIDPDEYLVVTIDTSAFASFYGWFTPFQFAGGLRNSGEMVVLKNPEGTTIDSVDYDDAAPWPTEPDGHGPSLELISPDLDNSLPENWIASANFGGSPGIVNTSINVPPSSFYLIAPEDSTVFTNADFPTDTSTFEVRWSAAFDPDEGDTLNYMLVLLDNEGNYLMDTLFTSPDTSHRLTPPDTSGFFYWYVQAFDSYGAYSVSDTFRIIFDLGVGINKRNLTPEKFTLSQNYPNPFNPTTTIEFNIPVKSEVKLYIYNALGQKIRTLVNKPLLPGHYKEVWDGTNEVGRKVASGIYFYELKAKNFRQVKKMVLMK